MSEFLIMLLPTGLLVGKILIQVLLGVWVYQDAKEDPNRFFYFFITCLVPGCFGCLVYLLIRDKSKKMNLFIPKLIFTLLVIACILVAAVFIANWKAQTNQINPFNSTSLSENETAHLKQPQQGRVNEEVKADGNQTVLTFNNSSGRTRYVYQAKKEGKLNVLKKQTQGMADVKVYSNGQEIASNVENTTIMVEKEKEYVFIANSDNFTGTVELNIVS